MRNILRIRLSKSILVLAFGLLGPMMSGCTDAHQTKKTVFDAEGGLQVFDPPQTLILAEPNELRFRVRCREIKELFGEQRLIHPGLGPGENSEIIQEGYATLPISWQPDGFAHVEVVPLRLGQVNLTFSNVCPDRGFIREGVTIDVIPPHRSPQKLILSTLGIPRDATSALTHLFLKDNHYRSSGLEVFAAYAGVKNPVQIDAEFVKFTLQSEDGHPIIRIDDRSGDVTALKVGDARLDVEYGGLKSSACVVVQDHMNYKDDINSNVYQIQHCHALDNKALVAVKQEQLRSSE